MRPKKPNKIFLLVLCLLWYSMDAKSQSVEYSIKSTLIIKIAENIEWENLVTNKPFTILVLGKSPYKNELEKTATQISQLHALPVRIAYANELDQPLHPQVIFICNSEKSKLPAILSKVKNDKDVLIMGDSPEFSSKGVHINFFLEEDGSIHFELDLNAFQDSKLKPSILLLKISKIIK